MDYFGLWEGLTSPWRGYGKQPKQSRLFGRLVRAQKWAITAFGSTILYLAWMFIGANKLKMIPRETLSINNQQAWYRDGSCHAGHCGRDGKRATAGCAEWQGQRNAVAFQPLLKSRDIHSFTNKNDNIKCAWVECFQRTLQGIIHRHMTANRTRRFVDVLPILLCT